MCRRYLPYLHSKSTEISKHTVRRATVYLNFDLRDSICTNAKTKRKARIIDFIAQRFVQIHRIYDRRTSFSVPLQQRPMRNVPVRWQQTCL